jgi:hypothetical protein
MEYINKRMGLVSEEAPVSPHAGGTAAGRDSDHGPLSSNAEVSTLQGAPMPWSTGLAEVELPAEFKLRNIEATEAARRKAMLAAGSRDPSRTDDLGNVGFGNFTANYVVHRREYAVQRGGGRGGGFRSGDGPPRHTSSDDATMDRFRKQQRR